MKKHTYEFFHACAHDINTIIRFGFNLFLFPSPSTDITDAFIKLRLQVHEIMIPEKRNWKRKREKEISCYAK